MSVRYRAYLDDTCFFDTYALKYTGYILAEASVTLSVQSAGTAVFKVPPQNIAYGMFQKLTSWISIYRDETEIFYGRVYSIVGEFNTIHTITVEGALAALGDTVVDPFTFNSTLDALVLEFLTRHNERSDIQFELGNILVEDDYVYRAYETREKTKTRLDDLKDSYGGYMQIRHEEGVLYFDWYADAIGTCNQTIEFGENLIDLMQESSAEDIVTVLVPLGGTVTDEDTGESYTVDISSVTDDGVDYIEDEDAIAEFGRVWEIYTWDDVYEPANLLSKGKAKLQELNSSKVTITAKATDIANIEDDLSHFLPLYNVPVYSAPHGIDQEFLCVELTLNLLDPSKDSLTLGDEIDGYVTAASKSLKETVNTINRTTSNYTLNEINSAINTLTSIINQTYLTQDSEAITALAERITELDESIDSRMASFTLSADEITALVSANDLSLWITMTEEALKIGRDNSVIHSEQDNESYCFVDASGNVLLRIKAEEGVDADTVNVSEQVSFRAGGIDGIPEWALRLGAINDNTQYNLNVVYIGD